MHTGLNAQGGGKAFRAALKLPNGLTTAGRAAALSAIGTNVTVEGATLRPVLSLSLSLSLPTFSLADFIIIFE